MKHGLSHIAIAIITRQDQVLLSLRAKHLHQGGLWEFPGGKLEAGESPLHALRRECNEELGIEIKQAELFKRLQFTYPECSLQLDFFKVSDFAGEPGGREGQPLRWVAVEDLDPQQFPAANRPVIHALQLADTYMISGAFTERSSYLQRLEAHLQRGQRLLQLRCKTLDDASYLELALAAAELSRQYHARLLLNTSLEIFNRLIEQQPRQMQAFFGLHLTSQRLANATERPISKAHLLSVSCHHPQDLAQAQRIGADILLLSPVKPTSSHPGVEGIGWERFSQWLNPLSKAGHLPAAEPESVPVYGPVYAPVYALGGMQCADLEQAKACGAQGIAAISALWNRQD